MKTKGKLKEIIKILKLIIKFFFVNLSILLCDYLSIS
jgi:hypothetical protein